jgi:hypothetical protein
METNIKDTSVLIVKMVRESFVGQMEITIEEIFVRICEKGKVKWSGTMVVYSKANGNVDYRTVEVLD